MGTLKFYVTREKYRMGIIVQLALFKGVGLTLPKTPRRVGMEKFLKVRGDPKKGGFCRKDGVLLVWVFFLVKVWQM